VSPDAPTTEIGYTLAPTYSRVPFDDGETTPELVWPQSIYVYDQMRRTDSQVGSVLRAVTETLLRTPWRIDPAGAKARVTKFVADDLGLPIVGKNPTPPPRLKDRFSWPSHLREALLMLPMGHAYFEQVYRITDDGKAAHLRKLAYRPAKTLEYINVASDGGLISIQQYWTRLDSEPKPIPVDHLVAYIHAKEGGNWLGTSILRNCYKNWLLKDRLLRVQAQTIERNGMGIPLYTAAETETDLAKGLGMATSWRAGEAAGSAVPFGASLKLVGVEGTLPDAMPVIEYHDAQIARAVLAHFLNLGQQTGSWALGTTFADFFTMSLQTLAEQIRDTATQHIVEDLVDHNFGPEEPAPRLVFDEIGSRQAPTAQAIKTLVDAGVLHPDEVLEESSRQQYGLPPADPATATLPPGTASATPPATTQMGDTSPSVAASGDPKAAAAEEAELDEEADDWEDAIDALILAFEELSAERVEAAFDPAKHARNPKGSPGGGKFRSMADRLKEAITQHGNGDGKGHPLDGFDREQLRRVAKSRGVELGRGESRDSIAEKLVKHLGPAPEKTAAPKKAVDKPAERAVKKAAPKADAPSSPAGSLDKSVKSGVKSSKVLTSSGSGTITLVTFKDGTKAIKKTIHAKGEDGKRQVDAAELAASLAQALEVATPAVRRIDDREFYMEYIDSPTAYHDERMHQGNLDKLHGSSAGQMLGLFDLLIDYDDRSNRENWAFDKNRRIVALDHDTAWEVGRNPAKPPQENWAQSPFAAHWVAGKKWKPNDLAPVVADTIRQRLDGLRPEFERHGRGAWLDFALARLAVIEAHSTSGHTMAASAADDDGLFPLSDVQAKYNPGQLRDPGGEDGGRWVKNPASAAKDALKLAGKIDLADDEQLLGSAKIDGEAGGIRMALIDRGGRKMLRLGLGPEDYGKANRDEGTPAWDGNPTRTPLTSGTKRLLDEEFGDLNDEYDSASPERQQEIDDRQAKIRELLAADEHFNGIAALDEYNMDRLASKIRPALTEAVEQATAENVADDEIEELKAEAAVTGVQPDPDRLAALRRITDRSHLIVFDQGIIPGSGNDWGDVHWSVELDDPTVGPEVRLGVQPKGAGDDWGVGVDWQGTFTPAETRKFLRLLDQYSKGGVQAAAGVDTHPGGEQLKHYWVYGEGAAKWATWTELEHHLLKYLKEGLAKRTAAAWFHLRYGYWPGDHRNVHASADAEADDWEEAIAALVQALAELSGEVLAGAFDEARHPRGKGGKFRSTVDKLKDAIQTHRSGGGKGDPFEGFDREQLRRAAVKQPGITLTRGESRDSIAKKLLDDLDGGSKAETPKVAEPKPVKKTPVKRAPRKKAAPKPEAAPKKAVTPKSAGRVAGRDMIANGGDAKLVREVDADHGSYQSADTQLASIAAKQGFDGPPKVVSRSEMDRLTKDREPLYRGVHSHGGVSAAAIHEQTRNGPAWFGNGIFGNGYYFAVDEEKTRHYSDRTPGSMMRAVLDPDANIISFDDLKTLLRDYDRKMEDDDPRWPVFSDPGRLAAALGYDAVRVPMSQGEGGDQVLVLNRTALIIEEPAG